ncbi:MAG: BtpA/SgcQ family protein [Bacilli bacterium]|nr:BtpA/SgcQ family protein [Bacilli bacterium]MDD3305089.1 BtpA/SgcQ family protein [Bacilli bacterium]MDD4053453.1 BtpA/SgcQ family protein [Bacilli bacterium]MDD4410900.1 BtpA/SgcQ family protein [Bacilli bacterium]
MNIKKKNLDRLFGTQKPIIGMVHLKGETDKEIFRTALREIDILINNGIDAVMIENYFGEPHNVEDVLEYLYDYRDKLIYGVNILGDHYKAYDLADKYGASFIQIDSIAGHLNRSDDHDFEEEINRLRKYSNTYLFGGVRFKYQPYLSKRTLQQDLIIGMRRCESIVVTGDATGHETSLAKIKEFREVIGEFPLIVGAGLTVDNCAEQLKIADAGIVGSYLKDNHKDYGDVSEQNTREFMDKVKTLRMK